MAATVVNYARKAPDLQLVKFVTSSAQDMEDVRDWVIANLTVIAEVTLMTSMGGLLYWVTPDGKQITVRPNEYVAKDSNGKLFKMTQELVDAFYDPAP